ncbi:MAG TPA: type I 3-dehydroquinate dehydratase [Pseudomonadales bacterium]|nr:type I 3-dehydroquinate dehydratase [Pseudomonadales bacterium]
MKSTTALGDLQIGEIPYVVGTISSAKSLMEFAGQRINNLCDIVEVRLDEIGQEDDWLCRCREIETLGMPIILTTRLQSEGGKWIQDGTSRMSVIGEALKFLAGVDVEFKSKIMPQVCEQAKALSKAVVVSFHDFEKTPSFEKLHSIATEAAKHGTIVKISTMVKSQQDIATLEKLLNSDMDVPICIIGMGAFGTRTRIAFPSLGSCLTYGYLDTPSAPGQLSARMLTEQLRSLDPQYNQQFIIRKEVLEFA